MVDDLQSSEEAAFVVEGEVDPLLRKYIEQHLHNQTYDEAKVQGWINAICEDTMKGLVDLRKPFKYVVTCVIVQNLGAGFHTEQAAYCDAVNDGLCTVKWPPDKSRDQNSMYCVATVYGFAL